MKFYYLVILLFSGMFSQQSWAPPIKGGATGGAEAAPDISKCDLNPTQQTKVKIKDKDGKEVFICTGQAICGGKSVPVSCKVSERELCPLAKQCIVFEYSATPALPTKLDDFDVKCVKFLPISTRDLNEIFSDEKIKRFKPLDVVLPPKLGSIGSSLVIPSGVYRELAQPSQTFPYHSNSSKEGEAYKVLENKGAYVPVGQLVATLVNGDKGRCSGSLIYLKEIKEYAVITAAHCVKYNNIWANQIALALGVGFPDAPFKEKLQVKKAFLNQGFLNNGDSKKYVFDVALLIVNKPSKNIPTLGLLTSPNIKQVVPKGTNAAFPVGDGQGGFNKDGEEEFATEILKIMPAGRDEYQGMLYIFSNMHSGASGGPWIGLSKNNNFGFIIGINSVHHDNDLKKEFSPFFDTPVNNLYQTSLRQDINCEEIR